VTAEDLNARFAELRLIPVVVLDRAADAGALGAALKAGGLPCAEVTFRTEAAEDAIRVMAEDEDMLVGAGTVLRPDQVDRAVAAGARFIVSPGFSMSVVRHCLDRGIPVYPGVVTPTEIQMALEAGLRVVKFFPASASGGVESLKALSAPFPMVRFIPTGGITPTSLSSYLALRSVLAVGGSWMVAGSLIAAGNFEEIRRQSAAAVHAVSNSRGKRAPAGR
jgi:2-dehydro-3-deoxyphosphogluconate aldolase/(4S)-4-hydroxy-2-oxoglutarate aldolase